MNTPIYDYAHRYAASGAVRMHMPGHKGKPLLGCEPYDLTEISGADELFAPEGIIAESEANASALFGCQTCYSAEGSSLCIRSMLYLIMQHAAASGRKPVIAAARNIHKTFLTAAALLRFDIIWLEQDPAESYLSGHLSDAARSKLLTAEEPPAALWLTAPDYLGNTAGIAEAAAFCHAHDMLLAVDGAHGAYLRFLPESLHPADLGADLCCTSAHKTLPVLTGGAYLHIADRAPAVCHENAKQAMAMFASTSPSYLILESLDLCNRYLSTSFAEDLSGLLRHLDGMRQTLRQHGWILCGDEPMKLTLRTKPFGYTGTEAAALLAGQGIYAEFADPDYLVLMPSPGNSADDLQRVCTALCGIPKRDAVCIPPPAVSRTHTQAMALPALLCARTECLPVTECAGRICAEFAVACPPAVPIVICGERITEQDIRCMQYYGIRTCRVTAE